VRTGAFDTNVHDEGAGAPLLPEGARREMAAKFARCGARRVSRSRSTRCATAFDRHHARRMARVGSVNVARSNTSSRARDVIVPRGRCPLAMPRPGPVETRPHAYCESPPGLSRLRPRPRLVGRAVALRPASRVSLPPRHHRLQWRQWKAWNFPNRRTTPRIGSIRGRAIASPHRSRRRCSPLIPSTQPFRWYFASSPAGKSLADCPAMRDGIAPGETGLQKKASWRARSLNVAYEALEPFVAGAAFAALAIAARTVASVRLTICWVAFENCS